MDIWLTIKHPTRILNALCYYLDVCKDPPQKALQSQQHSKDSLGLGCESEGFRFKPWVQTRNSSSSIKRGAGVVPLVLLVLNSITRQASKTKDE